MSGVLVLTKVNLMLLPFNNVSSRSPSTYSARRCVFTTLGGGSSPHAHITICGLANFSSFPMATQLGVVFYLKINTLLSDPKVQMLNHYRIFSSPTPQLKSPWSGPFLLLGSSSLKICCSPESHTALSLSITFCLFYLFRALFLCLLKLVEQIS